MPDEQLVAEGAGLSQVERVVDTFVAPSKTFTDILRSANCWLPLVLMVVLTLAFSFAVDKKIGYRAVAETNVAHSPAQQDRMQNLTPEAREHAMELSANITRIIAYGSFVFILLIILIHTLLLWASFNFVLGAKATFPKVFAVITFAGLPKIFVSILTIALLFAGVGTDNFDLNNPVGTNLGYFLSSQSRAVQVAGSFFDVFGLWSLILLVLGMSILSGKKMAASAIVVVGWWVFGLLVLTGFTAAFS